MGKTEYFEDEGLLTYISKSQILQYISEFYHEEFQNQNKKGRMLQEKLAQIPFSLVVSMCPDDTFHQIYNDYNLKHLYIYFNGSNEEIELPDKNTPIVYNLLGSIVGEEEPRYVFTHEDMYSYLSDIIIPPEIKDKINEATHLLFIGFDFNKWYYRLLLYVLGFDRSQEETFRFNFEKKATIEKYAKFIQKQFNITSAQNNIDEFADVFVDKLKTDGKLVDLKKTFLENTFDDLVNIVTSVVDETSFDVLRKLESESEKIDHRIQTFQQLIS